MSSLAIPESVSPIALPSAMQLGSLPYSLPVDAMSWSVKIQPTNMSQVQSGNITCTASTVLDVPFSSQNVIFDIPTNQSPDTFLDTRFTCLNFRATMTTTSAGTSSVLTSGYLRSSAYAWFDNMTVLGSVGNTLESCAEFGVVNDTLIAGQMSNSARDGALSMGLLSATGVDNQGHAWKNATGYTLAGTTDVESHSYTIPLTSAVCGVLSNNFLNIGRLGRLQVIMQTAFQLPVTITCGTATAAGTIQFTLSDFSLSLEMVKIGASALRMLDETLVNGLAYTSGITYRTAVSSMTNVSGSQSILLGLRGSSIKSLFARFQDLGTVNATNSINGKYDSKLPMLTSYNFSIAGIHFPQSQINPLLQGSQVFTEFMKALGSFNSSSYQCGITPSNYYKLAAGGTAQGATTSLQNQEWNLGSSASAQCQFIIGQNTEIVARNGLFSGFSAVSSPIFLELQATVAPTNQLNVFGICMLDVVYIHNVNTGTIDCRI